MRSDLLLTVKDGLCIRSLISSATMSIGELMTDLEQVAGCEVFFCPSDEGRWVSLVKGEGSTSRYFSHPIMVIIFQLIAMDSYI